ncbi:MAG: acriflavin resistance protein [Kangiella sp.]|nr:MAG: acriflavin resistance protein [Kangiella sp.]
MWFTKLALKRPVTISMIFVCMVCLGIAASRLLPLEFFPSVQFPGIFVQANYPGSSPEEIEKNVTRPLEEALATMGGIDFMQSTSSEDSAQIFMLFDWGANAKLKGVQAREKVDAIKDQLPEDLRRVFIFTGSTNDQAIVQARLSSKTDLSDSFQVLNRVLKQKLERIQGVSSVDIQGVAAKTYQINLIPERIAAYHIDTNQLFGKLQQANALIAAGEVKSNNASFRVSINEQFESIDDIANFIINERGLRLSDIAEVVLAKDDIAVGRHLNREYAVAIEIKREAGSNLVETAANVVKAMEEVEKLPDFEGIKLFVMDNQGDGVTQSLSDIAWSGLIGFILSTFVLFFFLKDVKLTLIVSMAVPFSLMMTLAAMFLLGLSLNILSMMGLMLAIGMLVDNAVVVSESIFTQREKNPGNPLEAVMLGVKNVGVPVVAGTITTAIVFLPNIIGEKVGVTIFLSHVAITIVISLVASLFIATTIIPLMLSRLKNKDVKVDSSNIDKEEQTTPIEKHGRYSKFLSWLMDSPVWATVISLGLIVSIMIPMQFVEMEQGGQNQSGSIYLDYKINGRYEIERVERSVNRLEEFLYKHKNELDLKDVYSFYTPDRAGSTLLLKDDEFRNHTNEEIRKFVEKNMPKIAIGDPGFDRSQGGQNSFGITLRGEDTGTLLVLSENIAPLLNNIKGITRVVPDARQGRQEVKITLNSKRLSQLGLTPNDVGRTVSIALRKQQLKTFRGDYGETDITLTFKGQNKSTMSDLTSIPIELPNGQQTRLDTLASFAVVHSLPSIQRVNRRTSMNLQMEYSEEDTSSEKLKKATTALMEQIELPEGYTWQFGRGVDFNTRDQEIMMNNMLLALLMIFVVMAALFESLLFPFAVITSVVYAFAGVYWYFFLTGTSMSIMAMIGILVLMGVVVNNGIVLVDRINHYRSEGYHKRDAILHAANDRIRPILMTVLTTILGLLPLSMGDARLGGGGPPYFPMARAVIGGLGYSTIATLICLPVIYLFLDYVSVFYKQLWHSIGQREMSWGFGNARLNSSEKKSS